MDEPRERRVQAGRLEGGVAAVGVAQEQARHELRDDGPRAALLLPARHPRQGGRPAARVPVRGRAQGHCGDRLLAGVDGRAGAGGSWLVAGARTMVGAWARWRGSIFISLLH